MITSVPVGDHNAFLAPWVSMAREFQNLKLNQSWTGCRWMFQSLNWKKKKSERKKTLTTLLSANNAFQTIRSHSPNRRSNTSTAAHFAFKFHALNVFILSWRVFNWKLLLAGYLITMKQWELFRSSECFCNHLKSDPNHLICSRQSTNILNTSVTH